LFDAGRLQLEKLVQAPQFYGADTSDFCFSPQCQAKVRANKASGKQPLIARF
jgi:hypothetical protein